MHAQIAMTVKTHFIWNKYIENFSNERNQIFYLQNTYDCHVLWFQNYDFKIRCKGQCIYEWIHLLQRKTNFINKQYLFTITNKINVTPKGVYLPISKLHSILAVTNLLAHNNISQICYCGQFHYRVLQFFWQADTFGVKYILLAMVHIRVC